MQAVRSRAAALSRRQARAMSTFNTPSFFSNLMESSSMPKTPVDETWEFPLEENERATEELKVTTTPSGMRVVTSDNGQDLASVGVFVDAGSRYESHETAGLSHFLESVAFKSTSNRTEFRTVREMLKVGASMSAHASRENVIFAADVLRSGVPAVLGTFGDAIQNNAFKSFELEEAKARYQQDAEARSHCPDTAIVEGIHEAAYFNNTLGNPLYGNVDSFDGGALRSYINTYFRPERMVVSGVGVNHQELVDLTNHVFDDLNTEGAAPTSPKAQYTGGETRMHNRGDVGPASVAIAFETAHWSHADLVPMCVLQMLMGGGGSFSSGGPGKGMCSRLYTEVLNSYPWVESAACANFVYSDSALFGIHGSCDPQHVGALVDVFVAQAQGMTRTVSDVELSRAKNQLKSTVLTQLEGRSMQMEDIGRQVLTYGKVKSAKEVCAEIDAVSAADLKRVAVAMLKSPLSMTGRGDLSFLPRYSDVAAQFK